MLEHLRRRYLLTARFHEDDFDLGWRGKKFWFRLNANYEWYVRERARRNMSETDKWAFYVTDLRTGEDITPDVDKLPWD